MKAPMLDYVLGTLTLVLLAGMGVFGCTTLVTKRACLQAGYPGAQVSFALERYCVKRVDQTDIVVPLESAVPRK